jgi:quercetin dioxygenase-like cupin family protein
LDGALRCYEAGDARRAIYGTLLTLDLNREIEQLGAEGRWQSGHTAKRLVKYPDLRLVLIVMKAGGRLEKHRAGGRISVQTLDGRIRLNTAMRSVELAAGQRLTLEGGIPHDVEGIIDSAFLLTIAWRDASAGSTAAQR